MGDDLSFGPINPADLRQRVQWGIDELGFPEDPEMEQELQQHMTRFWDRITRWGGEIVAWISSGCTSEHCGLLELLWRLRDRRINIVVDVADAGE